MARPAVSVNCWVAAFPLPCRIMGAAVVGAVTGTVFRGVVEVQPAAKDGMQRGQAVRLAENESVQVERSDGSGGLTVFGASPTLTGTLFLTGLNSYTGGTNINAPLTILADTALGATSGNLTFGGGSLATANSTNITTARSVSLGLAGGTFSRSNNSS